MVVSLTRKDYHISRSRIEYYLPLLTGLCINVFPAFRIGETCGGTKLRIGGFTTFIAGFTGGFGVSVSTTGSSVVVASMVVFSADISLVLAGVLGIKMICTHTVFS
jgi:hypothetical protein